MQADIILPAFLLYDIELGMDMPELIKDKLTNLPEKPGVYMMKNRAGKVIYIGKAKVLKNRVRSYFQSGRIPDPKTEALVSKIRDFEILITDNEIEALILEANLVKEYRPRYNVDLKDDKRYPYIKITLKENFPKVLITRVLENDGSRYFGPYTDAGKMRSTVDFLHEIFPLRTCSQFPTENSPNKPCLNYQIGKCIGVCVGKASQVDYMLMINNVIKFLSGRNRELVDELHQQMQKYSEDLNFEAAARCRDQIEAMEKVIERQKVVNTDRVDRDYLGCAEVADDGCFSVLQVRDGILLGRQHYYYKTGAGDRGEFLKNFLMNYYRDSAVYPREILVGDEVSEQELVEEWLTESAGHKVSIVLPQKGQKASLLKLAESNASLLLDQLLAQKEKTKSNIPHSVYELQKVLELSRLPKMISAFDISNLGENEAVGSMVFFKNGKPFKGNYRRFKIKNVEGQDDFAMMAEVVGRYFQRVKEKKEQCPDLVLIDGGKGQLSAAVSILKSLHLEIPAVSLAKRIDEVFFPGRRESLIIPKSSPSLRLLQRVRDEAHRFAVTYHRNLRGKRAIASELDKIPGVGAVRRAHLLAKFGSVNSIKKASLTELLTCPGITKNIADSVYRYFHEQEEITSMENNANDS
ncbi:MAG: excinuclease ABC subunit UvrC [candidate division Zixibacteria bacterium]|nr:excinuclease ABC subunit UvrC [candidate division Zixibacteria bacterium]